MLAYLDRDIDASRYDGTTYPPLEKVPLRYAIVRRNEWMVHESDVVISGVTHSWGGAAKTLEVLPRDGVRFIDVQPSARGLCGLAQARLDAGEVEDTAYFEPAYLKDFVVTAGRKKLF